MDAERRSIIVREIEHWQRSKLLPDQYCEFLLNLYRDADTPPNPAAQEKKRAVVESHPLQWILFIGIISVICYFLLHFSHFQLPMQIGLFLLFVLVALGTSAYYRERKPMFSYLLFGVGAGVLLLGGPLMLQANGADDWGTLTLYVACCSVIWIVFGLTLTVPWIHFCGWAGLIFVYAVVVNRLLVPESWVVLQLCWLPLAILFGWLGWLLSRRAKAAGAVFFILACLLWFAPEAYAFGWTGWPILTTQMLLLGKLISIGAFGFALRKTWIEWVV